jgi:hypothetical protein
VVYLGRPIAPSQMSPNPGGGGGGVVPGAQIIFGDPTPFLTFGFEGDFVSCCRSIVPIKDITITVSYWLFARKNVWLGSKLAKSI